MKKSLFYFFALLLATTFSWQANAQILNQAASWPNAGWTLGGSYTAGGLVSDPSGGVDMEFSFDDDAAGSGSVDDINVESGVIDLTAAHGGGETLISVSAAGYSYNLFGADAFAIDYYDFDGASWVQWHLFADNATSGTFLDCTNGAVASGDLDISAFTATQLSGFKYRFSYDDAGGWQYGFCVQSPTIVSATPPACPDPTAQAAVSISSTDVSLSWTAGGGELLWDVEYMDTGDAQGTGTTITGATNPQTATPFVDGNTYDYYVRADCGGAVYSAWVGPYMFTHHTPPANDDCGAAVALTVGAPGTCTMTSGDNSFSNDSGIAHGCASYSNNDVWFSFVAPASGNVEIETGTNGGFTDGGSAVYSGVCGVFGLGDQIDCQDDVYGAMSGHSLTGLTAGATYYVAVWEYGGGGDGTFNICAYEPPLPPSNDECASATALAVNADLSCTLFSSGTLDAATASADIEGCSGTFDNDVWYSFVATATEHQITTTNRAGSSTDMIYQMLDGCGGTELFCHDTPDDGFLATGLTVSNTYLVRVDTWTGASSNTTFDICIGTLPPAPANDDCGGAVALTMGAPGACTMISGDNTSSTDSGIAHGCASYSNNDVWFSFVAPASGNVEIETGTNGGMTDGGMAVYSGVCGVFGLGDQIDCDDDTFGGMPGGSYSGLTGGATYYVAVWEYGGGGDGTFDICAYETPNPPANDDCAGAVALPVGVAGSCVATTATNVQGTDSGIAHGCASYLGGDVWFTFVAPASGIVVVETTSIDWGDGGSAVYSGACGVFGLVDQINCDDDTYGLMPGHNLSGLTGGATYHIAVWEYGNNSFGDFDICVYEPAACVIPTGLGETLITSTTAELAWTENGLATTWDIEYGVTPYTFTGIPTATGIANPYAITGLTATTDYEYQVVGAGCATWSATGAFTTLAPPPANDLCGGAIAVSCGGSYTGITTNATATDEPPACGPGTPDATGIWYSMSVATDQEVTLDFCGSTYDTRVAVYTGTCGGVMTCYAGNDDGGACGGFPDYHSQAVFNAFVGTTYYIYVSGTFGATGTSEMAVSCGVLCLPVPANADCASATLLTVAPSGTCTPTAGTNECAGASTMTTNCESFNTIQDVWYTFTTDAVDPDVYITVNDGTGTNWEYAVYETACPTLDDEDIACDFGIASGTTEVINLAVSTTYWLQVHNNGGADEGTFDICLEGTPPPPANDNACAAIELVVDAAQTAGSTVSATIEVGEASPSCGTASNNSVWFWFTSPADGVCQVTTDFVAGDTHIAIYEAPSNCADLATMGAEVGCNDDGGTFFGTASAVEFLVSDATALAGTTVYYVQVDHYGAPGAFEIQVNTCLPAVDMHMTSSAPTAIATAWTGEGSFTGWNVKRVDITNGETFAGNAWVPTGSAATNYTFTGLIPGHFYNFWVENDCGSTPVGFGITAPLSAIITPNADISSCSPILVDIAVGGPGYVDYIYVATHEDLYVLTENIVTDPADFAIDVELFVFPLAGAAIAPTPSGAFGNDGDSYGDEENEVVHISGLTVGDNYIVRVQSFWGDGGTVDMCILPLKTPVCAISPSYPSTFSYTIPHHVSTCGADEYSTTWTDQNAPFGVYTSGPQTGQYFHLGDLGIPSVTTTFDVEYEAHYNSLYDGGDTGIATSLLPTGIDLTQAAPCAASIDVPNYHLHEVYAYADAAGDCLTPNLPGSRRYPKTVRLGVNLSNYTCDHWVYEIENLDAGLAAYEYHTPSNYSRITVSGTPGLMVVNPAYHADVDPGTNYIEGGTCYTIRVKPVYSGSPDVGFGDLYYFKTWGVSGSTINPNDVEGIEFFTSREEMEAATAVAIYPNPNKGDFFNLNMTNISSDVLSLDIYDMFGKLVQSEEITVEDNTVNQMVKFNGELASGIYTVKIMVDGEIHNERLIIER